MKSKNEPLLDAKTMDGPTVKWAPNDIFKSRPRLFMAYHVMNSGYNYLTPLGVIIGGVVGLSPLGAKYLGKFTPLQIAGNGGIIAGALGGTLGLGAMYRISNSKNPKIPWTDEGIQQRVDGLSHNFHVRVLDLGVFYGLASAGGIILALGGPAAVGLSAGAFGVLQGLSLGSAVGSLGSMSCCGFRKN